MLVEKRSDYLFVPSGTVSPTPEDTSLINKIIRFVCTKIPDGKYSKVFNTIPLIPFFYSNRRSKARKSLSVRQASLSSSGVCHATNAKALLAEGVMVQVDVVDA
jgi:hypothetical protein